MQEYFHRLQANSILHEKAGPKISDKFRDFTNNNCESMNSVLKAAVE